MGAVLVMVLVCGGMSMAGCDMGVSVVIGLVAGIACAEATPDNTQEKIKHLEKRIDEFCKK